MAVRGEHRRTVDSEIARQNQRRTAPIGPVGPIGHEDHHRGARDVQVMEVIDAVCGWGKRAVYAGGCLQVEGPRDDGVAGLPVDDEHSAIVRGACASSHAAGSRDPNAQGRCAGRVMDGDATACASAAVVAVADRPAAVRGHVARPVDGLGNEPDASTRAAAIAIRAIEAVGSDGPVDLDGARGVQVPRAPASACHIGAVYAGASSR